MVQITVEVPGQALDDLLDNGIDRASWSSIRDIAMAVKNEAARITVPLSSGVAFTVRVSHTYKDTETDETINLVRHFFLTNRHILYDLAVCISREIGIVIPDQELRFTRKDGLERTYKPSNACNAVLNLKEGSEIVLVDVQEDERYQAV